VISTYLTDANNHLVKKRQQKDTTCRISKKRKRAAPARKDNVPRQPTPPLS
jgi:hypothetical protein